jgi:ribonuclease HI
MNKMEASITEVLNNYLRSNPIEEGSFTVWDAGIKKNWPYIINPPLCYKTKNLIARTECRWSPPPPGWLKLNFDGASRGNPGKSGAGFILRNHLGHWVAKKATTLGVTTNNLAELEAVSEGLTFCNKNKIPKLIIEGDSQIILNALRKRVTPNWKINSKLEEVVKKLDLLEEVIIQHIFREGNTEADKLANEGADGNNFLLLNP